MIDREKIIKGLKCCSTPGKPCVKECPYGKECHETDGDGITHLCLDALELLEGQKPLVKMDTYVCLNCGHRLENQSMLGDNVIFNERYNFCPACGKKVKWND